MNAFPSHAPSLTPPPGRLAISLDELAVCLRRLDPGSRALLDLSLRRRLPLEAMAGFLQTDPFDLARRRARAVARIAAELDLDGYGVVATVKAALGRLPDEAWGVPVVAQTAPEPSPVQADAMAAAARALMVRLGEQRERLRREAQTSREQPTVETEALVADAVAAELAELEARAGDEASVTAEPASLGAELADAEAIGADEATVTAAERQAVGPAEAEAAPSPGTDDQPTVESEAIVLEPEPAEQEQPTVESEAIVLEPETAEQEQPTVETEAIVLDADDQPTVESDAVRPWSPTRPPLAATDMAAAFSQHPAFAVETEPVAEAGALPPIAQALALAAASERAAAAQIAPADQPPEVASRPAPEPDRPAAPSATPCANERAPRRWLAGGGLLIGLLLAIVRLLAGRR